MVNQTRRKLLALPLIAPFAGGILANAFHSPSAPDNINDKASLAAREKIRKRFFPNVALRTHEDKEVRFYDDLIKGKVVMINVMYAECEGICPGVTANLVKVQKLLGDRVGRDVFMYSMTLKPETDTTEVLRHYMKMYGVGPGWTYLTGKPEDVELLRQKLGFTNLDPELDEDSSQHIGNVRYGNEPFMLWAACPAQVSATWIYESVSWVMQPGQNRAKSKV
ncbi:MAG: SCO family protein [Blastocatellia bacterium]|nr:SCO family protein [Blastocatellia bacterium]